MATTAQGPTTRTARPARTVRAGVALLWLLIICGVLAAVSALWQALAGTAIYGGNGRSALGPLAAFPHLTNAEPQDTMLYGVLDLPLGSRLLAWLPAILGGAVLACSAALAIRVLRALGAGRPFTPAAVRAVQHIGLLLLVGGLAMGAATTSAAFVYLRSPAALGSPLVLDSGAWAVEAWPIGHIILGTVILAVAGAFRTGARMQAELARVV